MEFLLSLLDKISVERYSYVYPHSHEIFAGSTELGPGTAAKSAYARWPLDRVGGKLAGPSDPHRHDHIAVAVLLVGQRAHLPGRLLVLELDADGALGRGGEEIEQVLRIEADGERVALVFLLDRFLGLAVFGAGGGKLEALLGERELYSVRALVGELRDAPQRIVQLAAFQNDGFVVLPRQHSLVVETRRAERCPAARLATRRPALARGK